MATRRRQWSRLSSAQQSRYVAAGASGRLVLGRQLSRRQVRDYYNRGGVLKAGRGHATRERPVRVPAPRAAVERLVAGQATTEDLQSLETWQRSQAPHYLQDTSQFGADTAAALAKIHLQPANWGRVEMFTRRDGTVAVYITSRRGRLHSTILPDSTSAMELLDFVRMKSWHDFEGDDEPAVDDVTWESP